MSQTLGGMHRGVRSAVLPAIVHDASKMTDPARDLAGVNPCEPNPGGMHQGASGVRLGSCKVCHRVLGVASRSANPGAWSCQGVRSSSCADHQLVLQVAPWSVPKDVMFDPISRSRMCLPRVVFRLVFECVQSIIGRTVGCEQGWWRVRGR